MRFSVRVREEIVVLLFGSALVTRLFLHVRFIDIVKRLERGMVRIVQCFDSVWGIGAESEVALV